jgi:DNA-binding NtrC family response regulator
MNRLFISGAAERPLARTHPVLIASGSVHPMRAGRHVVAGADPSCDLVLHRQHVAPRHASFLRTGGGVRVEALAGAPPVQVQGALRRDASIPDEGTVQVGLDPVLVASGLEGPGSILGVSWLGILGIDPRTLRLMADLAVAARGNAPIWLHGESGTGKERAAHAIHAASSRHQGPFRALNCAAMPETLAEAELFGVRRGAYTGAQTDREGAFEEADAGTLLLDEVGDLPLSIQAKLLRVLETGEVRPLGSSRPVKVDVRVIAATWRNLTEEATTGSFRFDLLQRLSVIHLHLPPLRDRPQDVPLLLAHALGADASWMWPDRATLDSLARHSWPGNVRQLANLARRAAQTGQAWDLLPTVEGSPCPRLPRRHESAQPQVERWIQETLHRCQGNRSAAARALGLSRSTLYRWLADTRRGRG